MNLTDEQKRELYDAIWKSRDRGIKGFLRLMANSMWDITEIDWDATKKEMMKIPGGRQVVKKIESFPRFEIIRKGGLVDPDKPNWQPSPIVKDWERLQRDVISLEDDWVDIKAKQYFETGKVANDLKSNIRKGKMNTVKVAEELVKIAKDLVAAEGDKCGPEGCIRNIGGEWRIMSGKTGKLWPQSYSSREEAENVLDAYHAGVFK
jgi:hypothetical protein